MDIVRAINTEINNIVWGPVMLAFLIGIGIYLSIKMNFFQFRKFGYAIKHTILAMFTKEQ